MQIIINKDIREYKAKDIGPLTLREAGFAILAIFTIFASRAIQRALLGTYISLLLYIPAIPWILLGFIKPCGLPFEKWFKSVFIENFLNPRNRPFCYEMTWDIDEIFDKDDKEIFEKMESEKIKKVKLSEDERIIMTGYK